MISAAASRLSNVTSPDSKRLDRRSETTGLVIVGLTALFGTALMTFHPGDMDIVHAGRGASGDVQNMIGPVGARIADLLLQLIGLGAFAIDFLLFSIGIRTLTGRDVVPAARTVAGATGATFSGLMLLHLLARGLAFRPMGHDAAGLIGSTLAEFTRAFVSTTGTTMLALIVLVASISALSGRPLVRLAVAALSRRWRQVSGRLKAAGAAKLEGTRHEWRERREAKVEAKQAAADAARLADEERAEEESKAAAERLEDQPVAWAPNTGLYHVPPGSSVVALPDTKPSSTHRAASRDRNSEAENTGFPLGQAHAPAHDLIPSQLRHSRKSSQAPTTAPPHSNSANAAADAAGETNGQRLALVPADATSVDSAVDNTGAASRAMDVAPEVAATPKDTTPEKSHPAEKTTAAPKRPAPSSPNVNAAPPRIVQTPAIAVEAAQHVPRIIQTPALSEPQPPVVPTEQGSLEIGDKKVWKLPPRYLVQSPPARTVAAPQAVLIDNARVLEQKLEDFKIYGQVTDIRPGPVVTTYEYKPAPGMRISKIVALRDDLTMSLSALRVRVVAPIPGRDVVGIEVPNKQRQFVYFREVLDSELFANSKSNLTVILGKDIEGSPVVTDLAKAPHMLVAGATGTGKSVGINSFLCSILYKASPEDVNFIMIDPKVLELCIYEDIPHLLLPPISEPHQAELALKWAVREMDRRYRVLAGAKVRNISGYRAKLPELRENSRKKKMKVVHGKKVLVDANSPGAELLDSPPMPETMSYIVVVIDEFADLIMASGKEVERSVARLAQKARACGIHVILATQRPSTDVLTGMIKANFPTRISFQVASSIDSKVVLGAIGAESLLGMGDLLYVPPGTSHLKRCHGTWITDDEVAAIADHWKAQGMPAYDMSILEDPDADKLDLADDVKLDTLFEDAVQVSIEAQQASVSFLQRKLGIGYGRAARIIDHMEAKGIVGPQRSANKPREILLASGEAGM